MRPLVRFIRGVLFASLVLAARAVEKWDVFELTLDGPSDGNPFMEVEVAARFTQGERAVTVEGFYDGGVYASRRRFGAVMTRIQAGVKDRRRSGPPGFVSAAPLHRPRPGQRHPPQPRPETS